MLYTYSNSRDLYDTLNNSDLKLRKVHVNESAYRETKKRASVFYFGFWTIE